MSDFKNRPDNEMPREKLVATGARSLTDGELLAIILQTGIKGKDVLSLALEILHVCNGFPGIEKTGIDELLTITGLSTAQVTKLKAAIEIGRRTIYSSRAAVRKVTSSKEAFLLLEPLLKNLAKENFMVILLNSRNELIDVKRIGEGTVNAASVYPRELMELGIRTSASGIILSHNHPSGSVVPSIEDRRLTMNMLALGELSSIVLHDHIIVGSSGYYSFADDGALASMKQQFLRSLQAAG